MKKLDGIVKITYIFGKVVLKGAYLQILWICFATVGLGFFGVFPATAAVFSVLRRWLNMEDKDEFSVFKVFWHTYKKEFLKVNIYGAAFGFVGAFLWFDLWVSKNYIQVVPIHLLLLIVTILYAIIFLYFFPVYVRYELKGFTYIKQAFFIAFSQPIETAAMIASLSVAYVLVMTVPILLAFYGIPFICFSVIWFSYQACNTVEAKKVKLETK